ncbi:MAG TPA: peptidoglycan DD-metalloendopeptidase family protein, partial [Stellaceae bacterium]|nr:peptidoglycan DD-metalloendopeptidase family protein [Stellaceae bacterium]
ISRRYDVPLRSIIDANDLEPPFRLAAGTRLNLPQTRFHVVKAGETLYAISRLYGVEVSTLASLNRLGEPYAIRAGEALELPPSVAPSERTASLSPPAAPAVATAPPEKPAPSRAQPIPPASPKAHGATALFAWPLEGRILESYGTGPAGTHNDGINIAARAGEPVRAAESGVVAYAGNELRGYGNLVLIKHRNGYMTAYAHNGRLLVKRGQAVKRGQEIATAGATGSVGTPQLHFEIRHGTRALDPIGYLPALNASAN